MRVTLGIEASQPASSYTPNPVSYNVNWKSRSALPSGWTAPLGTPTYGTNGTYPSTVGANVNTLTLRLSFAARSQSSVTYIFAHYCNTPSGQRGGYSATGTDALSDPIIDNFSLYNVGGGKTFASFYSAIYPTPANSVSVYCAAPSLVIQAITMDTTGKLTEYIYSPEGYAIKRSEQSTPHLQTISYVEMSMAPWYTGTITDKQLAYSYIGIDQALTQSQIESVMSGWGISAASYSASAATTNTDWSTGSAPTGWTATYGTGSYFGYSSGGTVNTNTTTDADAALSSTSTTPRYTANFTILMAVNITADSIFEYQMGLGAFNYQNRINFRSYATGGLVLGTTVFENTERLITPSSQTGYFIAGLTFNASTGAQNSYLLRSGTTTQVNTITLTAAQISAICMGDVAITMYNDPESSGVPGTPTDHKLKKTYVGYDTLLTQTAIETIASGWGWTP